ncbi:MAG TPA: hypothetical protein VFB84_15260 [Micromonosporaceae bacterium]|nr:hypothetical protein [Micromonosporaceae bacterium]
MTGRGPLPASARPGPAAWRRTALLAGLVAAPPAALVLGVRALRATRTADIGSMGLVQALPAQLYLALALLTVSFLAAVFFGRDVRPVVLAAHVVVLTVLLHGAATLAEPLPRFVPAWLHVGFTDYIARTGETLPEFDARFSWPGVFAWAAMATRAAGLPDAMPLLGWTPVALNLLYAATVYKLAGAVSGATGTAWLAVWLFLPANWVGQDYFSPQGLNYFFYLVILTVLVIWFRVPRLERARRRLRRRARQGHPSGSPTPLRPRRLRRLVGLPLAPTLHEPEPVAASPAVLAGLMAVVLVLFTASAASHQLTPMAILVSATMLVAIRRCAVQALPALLLVILLGYVSYLTVTYWSGHLQDMVGSFGRVSHTVNSGITERVRGDPGHLFVLKVRQGLALGIWALAALGAWRCLHRGRGDLALLALAGAPFLLLFAQNYGGEVFLRIYTFALPFMVVLVVALLVPAWPARRTVLAAVLACLLSVVLTGGFLVARYGNESFEQVRAGDAAAIEWLYANATPGVTLVAITSNVPWRVRDLEQFRYTPLGEDLGPDSLPAIEAAMLSNPRGAYLIMTEGQYVWAETFYGKPPGWGQSIERQIIASGRFRLVYSHNNAKIFILAGPRGGSG